MRLIRAGEHRDYVVDIGHGRAQIGALDAARVENGLPDVLIGEAFLERLVRVLQPKLDNAASLDSETGCNLERAFLAWRVVVEPDENFLKALEPIEVAIDPCVIAAARVNLKRRNRALVKVHELDLAS